MTSLVSIIKQYRIVLFIALFMVVMMSAMALLFTKDRGVDSDREAYLSTRNFRYRPFDMADASVVCKYEAKQRHGDQLLRSYFDEHSSRYEELKKLFFVVLRGDVGDVDIYEETLIYCHIDPRQHIVTYYKAQSLEDKGFWSSGAKFFN